MNIDLITKVLSNAHRREILFWLKRPEDHFPPSLPEHRTLDGVCAGHIFEKSKLSQATVSQYLSALELAGLVKQQRHGRWTFFSRDEEGIERARLVLEKTLFGVSDG